MKLRKLTAILLAIMIMATGALMTGCGGSGGQAANLEEWMADTAEGKIMQKALESEEDLNVTVEGNCIVMTLTDEEAIDEATKDDFAAYYEGAYDEMAGDFEEMTTEIEELSGLEDITVKIVCVDASGDEFFSKEY